MNQIYEDPEKIYLWGRRFIGFKNIDQLQDIESKFWEKINEYIEDEFDDPETVVNSADEHDINFEDLEPGDGSQVEEFGDIFNTTVYGLDFLLEIIKVCHNIYPKGSGFTRPFDFTKYVTKLPYIENENGKIKLLSRRVKFFLNEYQYYCDENDIDSDDYSSFYEYIDSRCEIDRSQENKFKNELQINWPKILERKSIVEKINEMLGRAKIGIIEVKNPSSSDSQKIFNIINSQGEPLTAVEILSSKPHWNIEVPNPSQSTIDEVKILYQKTGTVHQEIVRWDLPATFIKRLGNNIVFKEFSDSKTDFGKELTIGFKLLAGLYVGGVKKEDIEKLGKKKDINWSTEIDNVATDLKMMLKVMCSYNYFKFFESWKTSIYELTSEAACLNFIILCYNDWKRKGKPVGNDTRCKMFQKNCFILWDKIIYEYVLKLWKGAADQKTANNILAFGYEQDLLTPVESGKWGSLLKQIFEENAIDGLPITLSYMTPLLYHFYCMKFISGPSTNYDIEVDHIIPQTLFKSSTLPGKEILQNNLLNLALLPKDENISKSNKKLIQIDDPWLKGQIEKYEFIVEDDYKEYSNVNNYSKMYKAREKIFYEAFSDIRENILNC